MQQALFIHVKRDAVGVERVGAKRHTILGASCAFGIVLRHHIVADHAAGLADIELMRPVAGVGELVLGQAPSLHFGAHLDGQALIVAQEP